VSICALRLVGWDVSSGRAGPPPFFRRRPRFFDGARRGAATACGRGCFSATDGPDFFADFRERPRRLGLLGDGSLYGESESLGISETV
jgi:hypothetical protein